VGRCRWIRRGLVGGSRWGRPRAGFCQFGRRRGIPG
jgi:hypothetical protein